MNSLAIFLLMNYVCKQVATSIDSSANLAALSYKNNGRGKFSSGPPSRGINNRGRERIHKSF
jgi:hypothetical protein